jgi:hypothetical protein
MLRGVLVRGLLQCSQSAGLLPPVAECRVAKPCIITRQGWGQSMRQTLSCCNATVNKHGSGKALQHSCFCYGAEGTSTGSAPVQCSQSAGLLPPVAEYEGVPKPQVLQKFSRAAWEECAVHGVGASAADQLVCGHLLQRAAYTSTQNGVLGRVELKHAAVAVTPAVSCCNSIATKHVSGKALQHLLCC